MKLIDKFDDTMPCLKAICFKPRGTLTLNLKYSDPAAVIQGCATELIGSYLIEAPEDAESRVKAKVRLNAYGILELVDVAYYEEVEELDGVDDEICSEEHENANKSAFSTNHKDLIAKIRPLMSGKEFEECPFCVNLLNATIESYKKSAVPGMEDHARITYSVEGGNCRARPCRQGCMSCSEICRSEVET